MINNSAKNISENKNKSNRYNDIKNIFGTFSNIANLNEAFQNGSAMTRMQSAADLIKAIMQLAA